MNFFKKLFRRKKRYKFNRVRSYVRRWDYYGGGSFNNPIAKRRKRKNLGYKISGYGGF